MSTKLWTLENQQSYNTKIKEWVGGELDKFDLVKLTTAEGSALASYELRFDGTKVGSTINIPKDYFIKSMEIKTAVTANQPETGYAVGDKYFEITVNTAGDDGTAQKIYLKVEDAFASYTESSGITITGTAIAVNNGTGLEFNASTSALQLIAQSSNAGAPAIGGISTADYAAFKGAANTFGTASTSAATAPAASANGTVTTTTVTIPSTDVGGTTTSNAISFSVSDTTYSVATASDSANSVAAKAGLMSGADKDNLDALVAALGADVSVTSSTDIDALFD